MKNLLATSLALAAAAGAHAQEVGRVLSSTPVIEQVAVQRQVCQQQAVPVQRQTSGMGGLFGAIAGAAIGSQIGHGGGRAAATIAGTMGGAILGNQAEAGGGSQVQMTQACTPQTFNENRTVGYDVTYEYNGRQQTVRMANDPGATVQLQMAPVGAAIGTARPPSAVQPLVTAPRIAQAPEGTVIATSPQPAPVVITQPLDTVVNPSYAYAPRVVYPAYWYPPISFSFGYVYGGHRHGGHRHWR